MAVTYRAIGRYSARRVSSTSLPPASGFDSNVRTLKQARQIVCRAALLHCIRLKSILEAKLRLVGALRLWLSNLIWIAYVTLYWTPYLILTAVVKWSVRWALTVFYSRNDVVCVTFDDQHYSTSRKRKVCSCWSHSVYLVDSGRRCPTELRRLILDGVKNQPALKLVRKPEAFGWIHLWKCPESTLRMSSVQELSPVWKHQLVTEDSVQEYVSEIFRRPDGLETDGLQPPWRIYLIPLVADPENNSASGNNCCLVVRSHRLLSHPLDRLIRQAIEKTEPDGPFLCRKIGKHVDAPHRPMAAGSRPVHVSWTRPIPSTDFIDRICNLTGSTCHQIVLAAFCQSINQCYRQSVSSTLLRVEMSVGFYSNPEYYSLPLGSSALEDGQLVLQSLTQQLENRNAHTWIPFRNGSDSSAILSVTMEIISTSRVGTVFYWSSPPTRSIPIRLCLWMDDSVIRLGLTQHDQLEFPVRAVDIERRIHQLAAGLGVLNRRPLSPHSSPSSSPQRLTPPSTPHP